MAVTPQDINRIFESYYNELEEGDVNNAGLAFDLRQTRKINARNSLISKLAKDTSAAFVSMLFINPKAQSFEDPDPSGSELQDLWSKVLFSDRLFLQRLNNLHNAYQKEYIDFVFSKHFSVLVNKIEQEFSNFIGTSLEYFMKWVEPETGASIINYLKTPETKRKIFFSLDTQIQDKFFIHLNTDLKEALVDYSIKHHEDAEFINRIYKSLPRGLQESTHLKLREFPDKLAEFLEVKETKPPVDGIPEGPFEGSKLV